MLHGALVLPGVFVDAGHCTRKFAQAISQAFCAVDLDSLLLENLLCLWQYRSRRPRGLKLVPLFWGCTREDNRDGGW